MRPLHISFTPADSPPLRGLRETAYGAVSATAGFWAERLRLCRETTIPHVLDRLNQAGHIANFDKAAGAFDGDLRGHGAFDSDLYKAMEGVMYCLRNRDDRELHALADNILDRILAAQQEDGFLIAFHIVNDPSRKWEGLRRGHQMYNAGHFFEMAVAHFRLTNDPTALLAARRFADHIDNIFGPGKRYDVDGHQEIELALVKLYRATGERRYLELCRFFLDERGYAHGSERKPFDPTTQVMPVKPDGPLEGEKRREFWHAQHMVRNGRMQDHKPVADQHEAIGHAVRAAYMYAAMADILRFQEDAPGYQQALNDIWTDVVTRKLYITGGIGSGQYDDEGFGDPYLLPNETAYCESCAAIANILWQHRMALLTGHTRYIDVMEITLFNGMLSGLALEGNAFFYENHLASEEGAVRRSWIGIACCPTNLVRMIPQVVGLVYALHEFQVFVNLYMSCDASLPLGNGVTVHIAQHTEYPWNGDVQLTITPDQPYKFTLCLRIPGWATGSPLPGDLYRFAEPETPPITLTLNGDILEFAAGNDGYIHITRTWQPGDTVELDLPMPVRRVLAHDNIEADHGKTSLMRGPVVYCIESADHPNIDIAALALPRTAELHAEHRAGLLGGVTVIHGEALDPTQRPVTFTAIPYYAWANRAKGAMTVWITDATDF